MTIVRVQTALKQRDHAHAFKPNKTPITPAQAGVSGNESAELASPDPRLRGDDRVTQGLKRGGHAHHVSILCHPGRRRRSGTQRFNPLWVPDICWRKFRDDNHESSDGAETARSRARSQTQTKPRSPPRRRGAQAIEVRSLPHEIPACARMIETDFGKDEACSSAHPHGERHRSLRAATHPRRTPLD